MAREVPSTARRFLVSRCITSHHRGMDLLLNGHTSRVLYNALAWLLNSSLAERCQKRSTTLSFHLVCHGHILRHRDSLPLANDVPRVYYARQPAKDSQADVNEKVGTASSFENHGDRWEEDGQEVEADVAC